MDNISSYEEMVRFLSETGLLHQAEPSQALVKVPVRKGTLDGVMFIRWQADHQVIHFIQTIPVEIPVERLPAVALASAILNHAMPIPGFGINVGSRQAYFRITMPLRPDGTLSRPEIQGLFNLAVRTAAEHHGALREVAVNGADPMHILEATAAAAAGAPD
jgi:hypothetical protein